MMRYNSLLISPKKEEQQVPDTILTKFSDAKQVYGHEDMDIMELEGFLGIEEEDEEKIPGKSMCGAGHLNWDFMDWEEEFPLGEEEDEQLGEQKFNEEDHYGKVIKREDFGFGDGDEKMMSLNLNLNYQEGLRSLMGEVPVMEEEKTRREASVLRYKEKRQPDCSPRDKISRSICEEGSREDAET
ncbi:hypothetical protein CK203_078498 [Vitis vinifera]|uniref:Uncharacterized protein n=1 Tax=Vitis vinifera TaxID=29760 RepID=A0A438FAB4_VITVI|nr:hypothetical protein CK203_078498 [Vitis vinifera]